MHQIFKVITIIVLAGLNITGCSKQSTEIPKSIILIIADGAGIGHLSSLRYLSDDFAPKRFENVGLVTNYMLEEAKVTDSGAAGTAMSSGFKTFKNAIGMTITEAGDTVAVKSVLEYAQEKGMATGLVTTSFINDATPATFCVHHPKRKHRVQIAHLMADAGVDVLLGGGDKFFKKPWPGSEDTLTAYNKFKAKGVQIISSLDDPIDPSKPVLGIFAKKQLPNAYDGRDVTGSAMAEKALELVGNNENGFFLLIEEEGVDNMSHDRDSVRVLAEMQSVNDIINVALDYQSNHPEVLVIYVSDHDTGSLAVIDDEEKGGLKMVFATREHTTNLVPIFSSGPGAEVFEGVIDNTFIGQTLIKYFSTP
jgi:alkaline phosphatase